MTHIIPVHKRLLKMLSLFDFLTVHASYYVLRYNVIAITSAFIFGVNFPISYHIRIV